MSTSIAGLHAFLFTDIEGSSVRWLNHRADMEKAVARHDAIVRKIVGTHAGKIFKTAGDAFYITFSKPAGAANAAIALQRAFLAEDFSAVEGLKVRMAMHFGSAEKRSKDFFGPALNRTARLLELAHGGQILVSASTAEVIAAERDVGATFIKVGASPLDDPAQVVEVHQLVAPDLPRDFPPLRRPKNQASEHPRAGSGGSRKWIFAALGLVIALAAVAALFRVGRGSGATPATAAPAPTAAAPVLPEKSVAVLPFDNLSKEEENAFFTNGMQDEILTDLARIADLKVISRSSVMHYKTGVQRNLREIGQTLGVAYVLEGSVQRLGGRVRVTAQLVDTRSDAHVWAQRYDRDLADAFAIQSDVAEAIAAQLRAKISPAEKVAMAVPPTKDLAAFDSYQRAMAIRDNVNGLIASLDDVVQVVQLLDTAVARDPSFRIAYSQLALTHLLAYWFNFDHTEGRLALAEAAVKAAEKLDPNAGETHLARGARSYWAYRDMKDARQHFELANRALPNDTLVMNFLGLIDRREGKWEDAVRILRRANELDPHNRTIVFNLWSTYVSLQRYPDAITCLKRDRATADLDTTRLALGVTEMQWTGDLKPWREAINAAEAVGPGGARDVSTYSFDLAEYERDPAAAANALDAVMEGVQKDKDGFGSSRSWYAGRLARLRGDAEGARKAFTEARREVQQILRTQSETAEFHSRMATIDGYLGRRDDAIREGKRACELVPISRDKLAGPQYVSKLAAVYALLGEKDEALEQLALLAGKPAGPPYGDLLLNPDWDSLRGDPRFLAILAKLAPKDSRSK